MRRAALIGVVLGGTLALPALSPRAAASATWQDAPPRSTAPAAALSREAAVLKHNNPVVFSLPKGRENMGGWVGNVDSTLAEPQRAGSPDPSLESLLGRPIVSVQLERLGQPYADTRLTALIETQPGKPLAMRDVRSSLLHLFNSGLFEDVVIDARPANSAGGAPGVALTYRVTPARTVVRYAFEGDVGLPDDRLRRALVDRFGARPAISRVQGAIAMLDTLFRDAGYLNARVTSRFDALAPDTVALVFIVEAGVRARIGRLEVTGQPTESREALLDRLDLASGQPLDGVELAKHIDKAERELRNRNYYEASITTLKIEREGGRVLDVTVDVQPGPRVTLRVEGATIPASKIDELIPVRREGSIDEDLLEDSKRRVESYLKGLGHWKAEANYERRPTPAGLDLVFTVHAGPVYRVASLRVEGNEAIGRPEIDALFAVAPGDLYIESDIDARTATLLERYRRQGYSLVKIDQLAGPRDTPPPGLEAKAGAPGDVGWVDLGLAITERTRTLVNSVTFTGNAALDEAALKGTATVAAGAPFYEPQLNASREAIQTLYLNRGFDRVAIDARTTVSADQTKADIAFTIQEGAQLFIDRIVIVGNNRTDLETIEKALTIESGAPLGLSALFESQRRLSALGLFRRVRITDVGEPGETRRDVIVTVEEAPATTVGYGAGLEMGRRLRAAAADGGGSEERVELAARGFFELGRRNLFGTNKSATLFMRGSLRQRERPDPNDSSWGFNEYRVLANLRDPSVFGTQTSAEVAGYFEQAIRSSFNFRRRGLQSQFTRPFPSRRVTLVGSYSLTQTELFDEQIAPEDQLDIDRLFPQVRLSIFSLTGRRDMRDDVLDPTSGSVIGLDGDMALRGAGSQVGFLKGFAEAFWYKQIPRLRKSVFAAGARIGLARGLERQVVRLNESGDPVLDPGGQEIIDTITDLPASERFFAGGDTTIRGFARDTLGDTSTIRDGFPTGGNALLVFNAELRVPVWRDFGAVVFTDAGNVFRRVSDIDLGAVRPTAGFGIRYKSPIGPIRVDLGFKLDRSRFPDRRERLTEFHISIGQAF